MISQIEIQLRTHHMTDAALHIVGIHVAPGDGSGVGTDNVCKPLFFIAPWLGYHEGDIHIAAVVHTFGETVTCGSKTSKNVWGKFPPKH